MALEMTLVAKGPGYEIYEERPAAAAEEPALRKWVTAREIGFLLGCSDRRAHQLARENAWRKRSKRVRGGKQHLYRLEDVADLQIARRLAARRRGR